MEHPLIEELTPQEIENHYSAAMDSVNLINSEKPFEIHDKEWTRMLNANKEHLKIMLAKNYWTDQDLTPLQEAVNN